MREEKDFFVAAHHWCAARPKGEKNKERIKISTRRRPPQIQSGRLSRETYVSDFGCIIRRAMVNARKNEIIAEYFDIPSNYL